MRIKSKKYLLALAVLTLTIGAGIFSVNLAKADDGSYPPFVEAFSVKFGLNEEEVATFFDEQRAERHANRMQNFEENLQQAVDDGVITSDQMQELLDKHEEMQAQRFALRSEMDDWFESAGINQNDLAPYMGHHHGMR